jgi:hypothetical protein
MRRQPSGINLDILKCIQYTYRVAQSHFLAPKLWILNPLYYWFSNNKPEKFTGLLLLIAFLWLRSSATAQNNLAATPPMGWNSWNHFAERIDDKTVRETADALVSTELRDAGYIYLNIDDTWQGQRDANGIIHPNEKFPEHEGVGWLCPSQRSEAGDLFFARPKNLRRVRRKPGTRGARRPHLRRVGNRLFEIRLVPAAAVEC